MAGRRAESVQLRRVLQNAFAKGGGCMSAQYSGNDNRKKKKSAGSTFVTVIAGLLTAIIACAVGMIIYIVVVDDPIVGFGFLSSIRNFMTISSPQRFRSTEIRKNILPFIIWESMRRIIRSRRMVKALISTFTGTARSIRPPVSTRSPGMSGLPAGHTRRSMTRRIIIIRSASRCARNATGMRRTTVTNSGI